MSKMLGIWMLCMMLFPLPLIAGEVNLDAMDLQPPFEEVCKTGNVDYVDNYGGGDEVRLRYHNVFSRFIDSQNGSPSFWFYVYKKGNIWLCDGANKEDYQNFPEYVAVRVYQSNQETKITRAYNTHSMGVYILNDLGSFEPFYFTDHGNHAVLNYLQPNTVVLSASLEGSALAHFETGAFRQIACGEEDAVFEDLLRAFTLW